MSLPRPYARARFAAITGIITVASVALTFGCSADRVVQPSDGDIDLSTASQGDLGILGQPVPLDFETYENSHQVVHPSAVAFPSAWHGHRFWLALTPYPNGASDVENPSLFGSANGDSWRVPSGVTNPLATTGRGYLSDPELIYDPAGDELRLYYREVVEARGRKNRARHKADIVYLTRSNDGEHWSAPTAILNDMGHYVVSPAVSRRADGSWLMWSVDAGTRGCASRDNTIILRRSTDGVAWSMPRRLSFDQPGYLPWHLDVQYAPQMNAYWALVAAYPRGRDCTTSSLFLATSPDGVAWTTYPTPALARGVLPQFSTNVYRSTFAFEGDGKDLTIWLTGAATEKRGHRRTPAVLRWSAAVWHTNAQALLEHVRMQTRNVAIAQDTEPSFLRHLAATNALP